MQKLYIMIFFDILIRILIFHNTKCILASLFISVYTSEVTQKDASKFGMYWVTTKHNKANRGKFHGIYCIRNMLYLNFSFI